MKFIIAHDKPWGKEECLEFSKTHADCLAFISTTVELNKIGKNVDTIYFIHWSNIIEKEVLEAFDCIGFHMTDLPFGRGGSPLQNLILRKKTETVVTAFQMDESIDGGPILLKQPMSLEGSAEAIYRRQTQLSLLMIETIIDKCPERYPQQGVATTFKRRSPEQSKIPLELSQSELYDFIRMLDATSYPRAFLDLEGKRIEFKNAAYDGETLTAEVVIGEENAIC